MREYKPGINTIKANIQNTLTNSTVAELRKLASTKGLKNAKQYKRVELVERLFTIMVAEAEAEQATKTSKPAKKYDYKPDAEMVSKQVEDGNTYLLGIHALGCIDDRDNAVVVLVALNRQALIRLMKSWGVKGWYRIYDKATMVDRLLAVAAA